MVYRLCICYTYFWGVSARRTVVIDDKLLEEAQRVLGTKGIRDTVEVGLRETIRRRRLEELRCPSVRWS